MNGVKVDWESESLRGEIQYAETELFEDVIKKLKVKTGTTNNKDALAKAVEHYLKCGNGACGCSACRRHDGETGECGLIRAVPTNPQFCEVGIR